MEETSKAADVHWFLLTKTLCIYITSLYESAYTNFTLCTSVYLFSYLTDVVASPIAPAAPSVCFSACSSMNECICAFQRESTVMHGILSIPAAYRKLSSQIQMLKAGHSKQMFT